MYAAAFLALAATMGTLGAHAVHGLLQAEQASAAGFRQALAAMTYARAAAADYAMLSAARQPRDLADADPAPRIATLSHALDIDLAIIDGRSRPPSTRQAVGELRRAVDLCGTGGPCDEIIPGRIDTLVNLADGQGRQARDRIIGQLAELRRQDRWLTILALVLSLGIAAWLARRLVGKPAAQDDQAERLLLDRAVDNMNQGLCLFDAEDRLCVVNRRFREIFSLTPAQVARGATFEQIVAASTEAGNHPEQEAGMVHYDMRRFISAQPCGVQMQELSRGRVLAIAHQHVAQGGFVVTYEDITDRCRAESQILFMARHDDLTGMPNRVLFLEHMEHAVMLAGRGEHFSVLCLNLDHFKSINDTLGHPVGDRLLKAVADRIRSCCRETDTVARLGADEFAAILGGVSRPEAAAALAHRIVEAISAPYELLGHRIVISTSAGIAMSSTDGGDAHTLLMNADIALDRAKSDRRGTFRFFEPGMDERMKARRALELDLRDALAAQQLEVFYQPLVDLKLARISGFEALLRWRHPLRGMIPPTEFIPVAEELGLINDIGEWTLRTACLEACRWPAHVKIAVNVSAVQFRGPHLVAMVRSALAISGLAAARLELEITESILLADSAATLATLHALQRLGVRIAMDDFGTGYSSLGYLRSFPFDKIKIDKSFVQELEKDDSRAIIRAVVGLGHDLRMRITAEGIESIDQLDQLRQEGCDELQGYLFARPQPACEIPDILARLQNGADDVARVPEAA